MNVVPKNLVCDVCGARKASTRKYLLHVSICRRSVHRRQPPNLSRNYQCLSCNKIFRTHLKLEAHVVVEHRYRYHQKNDRAAARSVRQRPQIGSGRINIAPFRRIQAFHGFVRTYRHKCSTPMKSLEIYFAKFKPKIENVMKESLTDLQSIKSQLTLKVKFKRFLCESKSGNNIYEYQTKFISSHMYIVLNQFQSLERFFELSATKIEHTVSIFEQYGSGWQFDKVLGADIQIGKLQHQKGGQWKDIPRSLKYKKALVNINSKGNFCFRDAVLSCLHKVPNPSRESSYKNYIDKYDFDCVSYPVSIKDIPRFEKCNNIAVNVFSFDPYNGVVPLQISQFNYTKFPTANLLLLNDSKSDASHYVSIRDMNRLLGSSNHHAKTLCYNCLQRIPNCDSKCEIPNCTRLCKFNEHCAGCQNFSFQKIQMPKLVNGVYPYICFENYRNQLKGGYVMYADMECLLKPIINRTPKVISNTVKTKRHVPTGFSYAVVKEDGTLVGYRVYRGKDAVQVLLQDCLKISELVIEIYKINIPLVMSVSNEQNFISSKLCHICGEGFSDPNNKKCRDHNHLDGKYRGASHQNCNVIYQQKEILPVVMHNLRSYDAHLIVKGLNNIGKKISVIPTNSEKYMSISVDHVRFIDSMQFMNCSLSELVDNLKKNGDGFELLGQIYNRDQASLLTRKGVFPYDYIDSWDRFKERDLPGRQHFFNTLRNRGITAQDYQHAKKVFREFKCQDLGSYHDLYLLSDSLLLASVFEEFRKMSLRNFKLDPVHYLSAPGLAWDAALKMTGVQLELVTDIDKYIFFEEGIRGGISQISRRHAEADNHYMEGYKGDGTEENQKYIVYWDMVNLYGKAMEAMLPVGDFVFLDQDLVDRFDIMNTSETDDIGYIVEADILYPKSLHIKHQDYPLAVERRPVSYSEFSRYQNKLLDRLPIKYMEEQPKLVPTLYTKLKYKCHYNNLRYYIEQGLVVQKIHRVLAFRQKAWLKPYVQFNSEKRANATNEFEKMFHKLCINAVFGKGMESVRKRMNVRLVNNRKTAMRLIGQAQFLTLDILGSNLVAMKLQKRCTTLNKAIYTGFSVLELSKLHMAKFHYDIVKKTWGSRAELLMTDTDSLAYLITTRDLYQDLVPHQHLFDTSNLPAEHPLFSNTNKSVMGKMKDEAKGDILHKFVGLGPKSYCFLTGKPGEPKTSKMALKGVPKYIQKRSVTYNRLESVLFKQNILACTTQSIRSYKHKIYNIKSKKNITHAFDSKRFILDDGIMTLPYGHYMIKNKH